MGELYNNLYSANHAQYLGRISGNLPFTFSEIPLEHPLRLWEGS